MKPPILQTNWQNRVAFRPTGTDTCVETFSLSAIDPKHPRALWVTFNLYGRGKERYGEIQSVLFDLATGTHRCITERCALERIYIDPERAGVGLGENLLQDGASHGRVSGGNAVLAWDFKFEDNAAPYVPLPAPWLYRVGWAQPKVCVPHSSAVVTQGRIELWHGISRHTGVTRIDLAGWLVTQSHDWATSRVDHMAFAHANHFAEVAANAHFQAVAVPMAVTKLFTPEVVLARLTLGSEVYRFDTWMHFKHTQARLSPTQWSFTLNSPEASLVCELTASPKNTVAASVSNLRGGNSHRFVSHFAHLKLELNLHKGRKRVLTSERAGFCVVQREPRAQMSQTAA